MKLGILLLIGFSLENMAYLTFLEWTEVKLTFTWRYDIKAGKNG